MTILHVPVMSARDDLRSAVAARAAAGASLGELDRDVVAPASLDEERRAALWLFAWHCAGDGAGAHAP